METSIVSYPFLGGNKRVGNFIDFKKYLSKSKLWLPFLNIAFHDKGY